MNPHKRYAAPRREGLYLAHIPFGYGRCRKCLREVRIETDDGRLVELDRRPDTRVGWVLHICPATSAAA